MTGPEHYEKAESLVRRAAMSRVRRQLEPHPDDYDSGELMIAAAQVHATLALAAAALGSAGHEHARDLEGAVSGTKQGRIVIPDPRP